MVSFHSEALKTGEGAQGLGQRLEVVCRHVQPCEARKIHLAKG